MAEGRRVGSPAGKPAPPARELYYDDGTKSIRLEIDARGNPKTKDLPQNFNPENLREAMTAYKAVRSAKHGNFTVAVGDEVLAMRGRELSMSGPVAEEKEEDYPEQEESDPGKMATERQMEKMCAGIVSFAASNTAVSLEGIRSGFKAYTSFKNVSKPHVTAFLLLGLSSVGSVKRIWAVTLVEQLQNLGDVPRVFAGAGSTYKAFLYLGYDILLHLSAQRREEREEWPSWLKTIFGNCDRICPGGDIRNAATMEPGSRPNANDRNAAIKAAREAFRNWEPNSSLGYIQSLLNYSGGVQASTAKGTITRYIPAQSTKGSPRQ